MKSIKKSSLLLLIFTLLSCTNHERKLVGKVEDEINVLEEGDMMTLQCKSADKVISETKYKRLDGEYYQVITGDSIFYKLHYSTKRDTTIIYDLLGFEYKSEIKRINSNLFITSNYLIKNNGRHTIWLSDEYYDLLYNFKKITISKSVTYK